MKHVPLLFQNTTYQLVIQLSKKAALAAIFILIARLGGEVVLGKYVFAYSIASIAMLLSVFGLSPLAVRETARKPEKAGLFFLNLLALRILFACIAFGLVLLFVRQAHTTKDTAYVVIALSLGMFPACLADQAQNALLGLQRMGPVAITTVLQYFVTLTVSAYLIYIGSALHIIAGAQVLGWIAASMMGLWFARSIAASCRFTQKWEIWRFFLVEATPLAVSTFFGILYFRIGSVMLSMMRGDAAVGWFGSAFHINEAFQLIPMSMANAMLPFVASRRDADSIGQICILVLKYNLIVAVPTAVVLSAIAPQFTLFVYGPQFAQTALPLKITIWAIIPISINFVLGTALIAVGRQRVIATNAIACCFISVALNYVLIRRSSFVGAAYATLLTECCLIVLNLFFFWRWVGKSFWDESIFRLVATAFIISGVVMALQAVVGVLTMIFLSIVIYLVLLKLMRVVSRDDLVLIGG